MRNDLLACCLILVATAGVDLLAGGPKTGPKTINPDRIQKLIDQLGSKRFSERTQADQELAAIGAPALELLRRAAKSPDPEIRGRADKLVSRLEQAALTAALLAPRRLRLTVKDASVPETVAELARLSGYKIQITGEQAGLSKRKVTLDTGEVTFWEALAQVCRTASLAEQVNTSVPPMPFGQGGGIVTVKIAIRAKGAGPAVLPGAIPAGRPSGPESALLLVEGKQPDLPVSLAGTVRIRVLPADQAKGGPPVPAGETQLVLEAAAEPRLDGFRVVGPALVTRATDDQGQTLKPVSAPRADPAQPLNPFNAKGVGGGGGVGAAIINGKVFVNGMPVGEDAWLSGPAQRTAPVRLRLGEKPAKSLRELSGSLTVLVLKDGNALVEMENILKAAGQKAKGKAGHTLHVQAVKKLANGDIQIQVALEKPGALNPLGALGANFVINGVQMGGPAGGPHEWPRLMDAKGQAYQLAEVSGQQNRVNNGQMTREATLLYRPEAGQGEPARLVLFGKRPVALTVPFTLKKVPLGGAQQ
jgi:hypothetical protein